MVETDEAVRKHMRCKDLSRQRHHPLETSLQRPRWPVELQCWVTAARIEAVLVLAIPHDDATPHGEPFTVTLTSARAYGLLGSSLTSDPPMASFEAL